MPGSQLPERSSSDVARFFEACLRQEGGSNLYQLFKSRQLDAMQAALANEPRPPAGVEFVRDIYDPFYGGASSPFGIRTDTC